MATYQAYSPDQAELLPAHVKDVLGQNHLCFLVHESGGGGGDLKAFESQRWRMLAGSRAYHPRMMLKMWLYGVCREGESTRKLEQSIREDLGFRYLAGGAPDHKTLSEFLRLHRAAIARLFTQVLQLLRAAGLARLGEVAIDSTRIKGRASRDRVVKRMELRAR